MITKVELTNFQSHLHTTLEMGKFTVLTGGSNAGKSVVLRALAGMLRNDSAGSFVTHGHKSLSVKVTLDDGNVVEWIKGGGENKYILTGPDGKGRTFDKVGSEVPEDIASVLRMGPLVLDGKIKLHANLHEQLDAPFLVSREYTAGDAAKIFGELTSASKLYAAVAEGNRRTRAATALRKTRKADLGALQEELKDYEDLDVQIELANNARLSYVAAQEADLKMKLLVGTKVSHEECGDRLDEISDALPSIEAAATYDLDTLMKAVAAHDGLSDLARDHAKALATLTTFDAVEAPLTAAAGVDLTRCAEIAARIDGISGLQAQIVQTEESLDSLGVACATEENVVATLVSDLALAYTKLDSCPDCGQELSTDEAKQHLLGGH